jgi:hypothetical protein
MTESQDKCVDMSENFLISFSMHARMRASFRRSLSMLVSQAPQIQVPLTRNNKKEKKK